MLTGRAHRTPVLTCAAIDERCGAELYFKCENFQKAGAFKIRGATNAVFALSDEAAKAGVVTHSSGNFAGALALAARWRGIKATVVMPENSPTVKCDAVRGYGGEIAFCKPTLEARETGAAEVVAKTGATFLHPYNDNTVIAGQGTAALELIEDVPALDALIAPVGGGGLLSGCAIAATALEPGIRVLGAEPAGADDAQRSLAADRILPSVNPATIADGLRTSLGSLTFPILKSLVSEILLVEEHEIIQAMRLIWERMKIVVEPSSAVPLAALLNRLPADLSGKRIGIVVSGGNVDLEALPWLK